MGTVSKVLTGTGILIAIYLLISNGSETTKVINAVSSAYTGGVKALQGR